MSVRVCPGGDRWASGTGSVYSDPHRISARAGRRHQPPRPGIRPCQRPPGVQWLAAPDAGPCRSHAGHKTILLNQWPWPVPSGRATQTELINPCGRECIWLVICSRVCRDRIKGLMNVSLKAGRALFNENTLLDDATRQWGFCIVVWVSYITCCILSNIYIHSL